MRSLRPRPQAQSGPVVLPRSVVHRAPGRRAPASTGGCEARVRRWAPFAGAVRQRRGWCPVRLVRRRGGPQRANAVLLAMHGETRSAGPGPHGRRASPSLLGLGEPVGGSRRGPASPGPRGRRWERPRSACYGGLPLGLLVLAGRVAAIGVSGLGGSGVGCYGRGRRCDEAHGQCRGGDGYQDTGEPSTGARHGGHLPSEQFPAVRRRRPIRMEGHDLRRVRPRPRPGRAGPGGSVEQSSGAAPVDLPWRLRRRQRLPGVCQRSWWRVTSRRKRHTTSSSSWTSPSKVNPNFSRMWFDALRSGSV